MTNLMRATIDVLALAAVAGTLAGCTYLIIADQRRRHVALLNAITAVFAEIRRHDTAATDASTQPCPRCPGPDIRAMRDAAEALRSVADIMRVDFARGQPIEPFQ